MTKDDIKFKPHSDMSLSNQTIVNQHQNLIKNNQLSDATALLNDNGYDKGFRASLFNNMQDKVRMIQEYLLAKEDAKKEEIVSSIEPTENYAFWLVDY